MAVTVEINAGNHHIFDKSVVACCGFAHPASGFFTNIL